MNIFRHIMAFIAALAIANPVCCCYAAGSDDLSQSTQTRSCCGSGQSSDSNKQGGGKSDPEHRCPCKDKLKTAEVKHLEIQVQTLKPIAFKCIDLTVYKAGILPLIIPSQGIREDSSPPSLEFRILYSVFRI
jgi:hypothetical protein